MDMKLRDFGLICNESINIIVINTEGRVIDMYDGKNSIMDQFLDREIDRIIRCTFNTIWVQVF